MKAFYKNVFSRALALLLAFALIAPCYAQAAEAPGSLRVIYSQGAGGSVSLGVTGINPQKMIYGVQLEATLHGDYQPDKITLAPASDSAFSPAFSTLVSKEGGNTIVTLYLVCDYALNNQGNLELGQLTANGLGVVPTATKIALLDSDQMMGGGQLAMEPVQMAAAPGADTLGNSYPVTLNASSGGTVRVNPAARENQVVPLVATPGAGYRLDSIRVVDSSGKELPLTADGDGLSTFHMPGGPVEIQASFTPDTEEEDLPFTDVDKDRDWFYDQVEYVYRNGLMKGTGNGKFSPQLTTSRGMIVQILYNLEGKPEVSGKSKFTDVSDGQWFADPVIWASENQIVKGYGDGSFQPNRPISRQEMAAILFRYAKYKEYDTSAWGDLSVFPDLNELNQNYAAEPMYWAVGSQLITGMSGKLNPKGNATRAQAATILMRFHQSNS